MAKISLKGTPINTYADLPENGSKAPEFNLTALDLSSKKLSDYAGNKVVLNIFPSVDTPVCASSVRVFNEKVASLGDVKVLCISKDLPFAQNRFCGAEGIEQVVMLSDFKENSFAKDYGVLMVDGPLEGLHSRAVVILDENGTVIYAQQTDTIEEEPNYAAALAALA